MSFESGNASSSMNQLENFTTLVNDRLSFGADKSDVVKQLVDMGLDEGAATGMVNKIANQVAVDKGEAPVTTSARREATGKARNVDGSASMPVIAGVTAFAAIIGAFVWSFITNVTGYELGLIAWGIGGLVGFATTIAASGQTNGAIQIVAVLGSIFGIMLGKYLSFLPMYNEFAAEMENLDPELIAELAAEDPQFSLEIAQLSFSTGFSTFVGDFGMMLGLFDLLWIFLAVSTAWKIAGQISD